MTKYSNVIVQPAQDIILLKIHVTLTYKRKFVFKLIFEKLSALLYCLKGLQRFTVQQDKSFLNDTN